MIMTSNLQNQLSKITLIVCQCTKFQINENKWIHNILYAVYKLLQCMLRFVCKTGHSSLLVICVFYLHFYFSYSNLPKTVQSIFCGEKPVQSIFCGEKTVQSIFCGEKNRPIYMLCLFDVCHLLIAHWCSSITITIIITLIAIFSHSVIYIYCFITSCHE